MIIQVEKLVLESHPLILLGPDWLCGRSNGTGCSLNLFQHMSLIHYAVTIFSNNPGDGDRHHLPLTMFLCEPLGQYQFQA